MKDFKLSMIQMACSEDRTGNLKKCLKMINSAAHEGADVVCLQELFCSTYFPQHMNPDCFKFAEIIPGEITESLQKAAQEHSIYLVVPLFEKEMSGLYYNSAILIDDDGEIIGKYRKNHIPDEPFYYEKYYFKPGNLEYPVFETHYARIGIGICWDQWFPETGRILALNGAELIIFPTAIAASYHGSGLWTGERMREEWIVVNRAQASMNKVFLAAVNRVGQENNLEFFGNSIICNPVGEVIEQANAEEGVFSSSIQASLFSETRELWPFFRDRRENTYGKLISR